MRRRMLMCCSLCCVLMVTVADAERRHGYHSLVRNLRGAPVQLSHLSNGEPGYYLRNAGSLKVTGIRWACVSNDFVPKLVFENEDLDEKNISPLQTQQIHGLTGEEHSCNVFEGRVAITEVQFSTGIRWRKNPKQYVPKPKRRSPSDATIVAY